MAGGQRGRPVGERKAILDLIRRAGAAALPMVLALLFASACARRAAFDEMQWLDRNPAVKRLGSKMIAAYAAALEEVTALLETRKPAGELLEPVKARREKHIRTFVELGREREAFDEAAKRDVVRKLFLSHQSPACRRLLERYTAAYQHYGDPTDPRNVDLLLAADMLGIDTYAQFEFLREERPEETVRLGIGPAPPGVSP